MEKITPFYENHKQLCAKIVPFAGFLMPVEYSGITNEHNCVRNGVGVFDVSHMGEIWIKGSRALDFVQWVTTNDASVLVPGKIQYSCFPNGRGGIVDDLLVYKFDEQKFLLVVNASNTEKDYKWLVSQNKFGVEIENSSDNIGQLAVQGPLATQVLQRLTSVNLAAMGTYTFCTGSFAGVNDVIISKTGYTGAGGFELYFYNADAQTVWNAVFEAGKPEGILPVGLGARDTLRLEMGYTLYGNDIDDATSPIEAGLGWIVKVVPHKSFIDKEILAGQIKNGVARKLVGISMLERAIPRHGYDITDEKGHKIGVVTSGTMLPNAKTGIGMAYIASGFNNLGNEVFVSIRGKLIKALVVKLPVK